LKEGASGDAVAAEDVQEEYASYEEGEERPREEEMKAIEGDDEDADDEAPSTLSRKQQYIPCE
jgi:hypothetical protein